MGRRNYLVEGLSGTGKTSVCDELQRRGHQAIHGDRELAYQGDPETGGPAEAGGHEHHATGEGVPDVGVAIDATAPVDQVVDDILRRCRAGAERES